MELEDICKDNFLENPPRWSGYTAVQTVLSIPSNDPSLNTSWVSQSNVISENSQYTKDFDYTTNPGSITYTGNDDIVIECVGDISMTSNTNNVVARFKWALNNQPELEPTRFLTRKIGTGSDVGLITATRRFMISKNDIIDFYFGCGTASVNINIEKAEWKIIAIAKVYE